VTAEIKQCEDKFADLANHFPEVERLKHDRCQAQRFNDSGR
jgi:hypothetical protein